MINKVLDISNIINIEEKTGLTIDLLVDETYISLTPSLLCSLQLLNCYDDIKSFLNFLCGK
jgi:hypothetical protein